MPHSCRAICIALGFTFLLCQQPAWSQVAREGKTTYSNFDIRDPDLAGNAKSNFRGRTKGVASQSAITNTVNAMNAAKARSGRARADVAIGNEPVGHRAGNDRDERGQAISDAGIISNDRRYGARFFDRAGAALWPDAETGERVGALRELLQSGRQHGLGRVSSGSERHSDFSGRNPIRVYDEGRAGPSDRQTRAWSRLFEFADEGGDCAGGCGNARGSDHRR